MSLGQLGQATQLGEFPGEERRAVSGVEASHQIRQLLVEPRGEQVAADPPGLHLEFVHELREVPWPALPWMVQGDAPRTWVLPEHADPADVLASRFTPRLRPARASATLRKARRCARFGRRLQ